MLFRSDGKIADKVKSGLGSIFGGRNRSVNDAIISPNGDIISTHPDDYLIATKNPGSLGGGSGVVINIQGGNFLSENVAMELGDVIIERLQQQFRGA